MEYLLEPATNTNPMDGWLLASKEGVSSQPSICFLRFRLWTRQRDSG